MGESILEKETNSFMEQLPSMLVENDGKYVVFRGDEHLGYWNSQSDALREAYQEWGHVSVLMRKVSREYEVFGREGRVKEINSLSA